MEQRHGKRWHEHRADVRRLRQSHEQNGGGTYATDSLNCATTFDGQALTYSSNGNLATYNNWTFTYDAQNRLTNAFLPGSKGGSNTNLDFYYDAKNRQIARSINGVITFSVWDDWELVEEYATGNVVTAKYLQGAHGVIKSLLNAVYYYQDSLGSTSHIASSTGALLEYYKYDLYGKPTYWNASGGSIPASLWGVRDLFSGERWISETSMYDLRNRFYSPDLGRFAQPDPIGFKGDASNLYRYCGNDWANRTDPMGLDGDVIGNPKMPNQPYVPPGANQGGASKQIADNQKRFAVDAHTAMGVERAGGNMTYAAKGGGWGVPNSMMIGLITAGNFPSVHLNKAGNWGNQKDPGYYVDGPLYANGKPAEGVTDAELRDVVAKEDGSLTGTLFVDTHVLKSHKGDKVDCLEQQHPNSWKEFHKSASSDVFMATARDDKRYGSPGEAARGAAGHLWNQFNAEKTRQRVWDRGGGPHDYSNPALLPDCP